MNHRDRHVTTHSNSSVPVIIRFATPSDRVAIERLAALDSAPAPRGTILVGELSQRPVVAVSLSNGDAVADPFVATADLLELVRTRAGQLSARPAPPLLQRAVGQVLGRVRTGRVSSRAASAHDGAPAAPAASA